MDMLQFRCGWWLALIGVLTLVALWCGLTGLIGGRERIPEGNAAMGRDAALSARESSRQGAASPEPGQRVAIASVKVVTLVDGQRSPLPDSYVQIAYGDPGVPSVQPHIVKIENGVMRETVPIGELEMQSVTDPPSFLPVRLKVVAGVNEVFVTPLGRLRVRATDLHGAPVDADQYDSRLAVLQAVDVADFVGSAERNQAGVARLLEKARDCLDGQLVALDGSIVIAAHGADVVGLVPTHAAWAGRKSVTGQWTGYTPPLVGPIPIACSQPVIGKPGTCYDVELSLARCGSISVLLEGWPPSKLGDGATGDTIVDVSRGDPGSPDRAKQWVSCGRMEVQQSASSGASPSPAQAALDFGGLRPGLYRIGVTWQSLREAVWSVQFVRVTEQADTVVSAVAGVGAFTLTLASAQGSPKRNLIVTSRHAQGDWWPRFSPAGIFAFGLQDLRLGADDFVISGLPQFVSVAHNGVVKQLDLSVVGGIDLD